MKKSYNKSISLRCITCGDSEFELKEGKTWVKCKRCEREYNGGYDELVELNQEVIDVEIAKIKKEITSDVKYEIQDILKKAFKNNKNIKLKK